MENKDSGIKEPQAGKNAEVPQMESNPRSLRIIYSVGRTCIRLAVIAAALALHHWRYGIGDRGILTSCVDGAVLALLTMAVVWTWNNTEAPSVLERNEVR